MPKSLVRGELQIKFKELNTKYQTLVSYALSGEQPLLKVYEDMLDDINELENICIRRNRY